MTARGLPDDLGRLLVVGAGGFAREVVQWAIATWPDVSGRLAGFVASEPPSVAARLTVPYLGHPENFEFQDGDYFLLGIGAVQWRRAVAESLLARQARFLGLIHPTAIVASTARLGQGVVVCPYAVISDEATVGDFCLLNYHTSLGHDATAGRFAVLSPYATLGGAAEIGEEVFLGMHASVGPGRRLGHRAKVSANSVALCDAPDATLVYGVPGRIGHRLR